MRDKSVTKSSTRLNQATDLPLSEFLITWLCHPARMSENLQNLIKRFDRHRNVPDAKFSHVLERQKMIGSALRELQEESSDFYSYVAESLKELDLEISAIKNKIKNL